MTLSVNGIWLSGYAAWLSWWPEPVVVAIVSAAIGLAPGAAGDWMWPWRVAAAATTCLWLIVWNIPVVVSLMRDFAMFSITPAW